MQSANSFEQTCHILNQHSSVVENLIVRTDNEFRNFFLNTAWKHMLVGEVTEISKYRGEKMKVSDLKGRILAKKSRKVI